VDDIYGGWNVRDDSNNILDGCTTRTDGSRFSHGTAVWTTAAAILDGKGLAGVAPEATVLMVKTGYVSMNSVYFDISDLVSAQDYLLAMRNNGVDIRVQIASYGGYSYSEIFKLAIKKTLASGMLMIASAGNDNNNNDANPTYPCSFDLNNIICVGASTTSGSKAAYSNYGVEVDISAPGTVYSPVLDGNTVKYASVSGTSFSTPLLGGVVMLLTGYDDSITPQKAKNCIIDNGQGFNNDLRTATNEIVDAKAACVACFGAAHPSPSPSPIHKNGGVFLSVPIILLILSL
jgi:subtilisin family serine protease